MQAYDYLVSKGVTAFCPMRKVARMVRGSIRFVMRPLLPNMFFAFGTEDEMKAYVYDNVNLPFLRFYYRRCYGDTSVSKVPLTVPRRQIETFMIICNADAGDTFVSADNIHLFETGEQVRVTQGKFAGVTGRVARFKGHKRVGIYIDGVATVATAYIPGAYLEKI